MSNLKGATITAGPISLQAVEAVISNALTKIGTTSENDLCHYLPASTGGYLHHFTLRKMKHQQAAHLIQMIENYIIKTDHPNKLSPKQRAPRGSRKNAENLNLDSYMVDKLLSLAKAANDKEAIAFLSPKKSLANCKKDLIQSIKNNKVDAELWTTYTEIIQSLNYISQTASNYQLNK